MLSTLKGENNENKRSLGATQQLVTLRKQNDMPLEEKMVLITKAGMPDASDDELRTAINDNLRSFVESTKKYASDIVAGTPEAWAELEGRLEVTWTPKPRLGKK